MAHLINMTLEEETLLKVKGHKSFLKKVYHIARKDKEGIDTALFKQIYNNFARTLGEENVMIRALNNTQFFTFKTFDDTVLRFTDFDEYYRNKVRDTDAFEFFYNMEVTTREEVPAT